MVDEKHFWTIARAVHNKIGWWVIDQVWPDINPNNIPWGLNGKLVRALFANGSDWEWAAHMIGQHDVQGTLERCKNIYREFSGIFPDTAAMLDAVSKGAIYHHPDIPAPVEYKKRPPVDVDGKNGDNWQSHETRVVYPWVYYT